MDDAIKNEFECVTIDFLRTMLQPVDSAQYDQHEREFKTKILHIFGKISNNHDDLMLVFEIINSIMYMIRAVANKCTDSGEILGKPEGEGWWQSIRKIREAPTSLDVKLCLLGWVIAFIGFKDLGMLFEKTSNNILPHSLEWEKIIGETKNLIGNLKLSISSNNYSGFVN